MKVAIFSDTHDNVPNLEKFLNWVNQKNIKNLIFCGDLCAPAIFKDVITPKYKGKLFMVFGNVTDRENLSKLALGYDNITHFGDLGDIDLDKVKIGFVHYPDKARAMAETSKFDFVFYGHTHKPWVEQISKCRLVNPGTLAGLFNKATFAVLDIKTHRLELKLLEKL